jgi:hypothetical protein
MSETKIKRRSFLKGLLGAAAAPKLLAGEKEVRRRSFQVPVHVRNRNPIFSGADGQWDGVKVYGVKRVKFDADNYGVVSVDCDVLTNHIQIRRKREIAKHEYESAKKSMVEALKNIAV